jgi:hypothetical protein
VSADEDSPPIRASFRPLLHPFGHGTDDMLGIDDAPFRAVADPGLEEVAATVEPF